jgi:hypothetical protein
MEFYYLHPVSKPEPESETGFKYLCYKDGGIEGPITLPVESGRFCAHKSLGKFASYSPDDEEIHVTGNLDSIKVIFKKVFEEVGFVIWKNQSL